MLALRTMGGFCGAGPRRVGAVRPARRNGLGGSGSLDGALLLELSIAAVASALPLFGAIVAAPIESFSSGGCGGGPVREPSIASDDVVGVGESSFDSRCALDCAV